LPALLQNGMFGRAVTSLGDLDGDGVTDLAVGAPGPAYSSGNAVHVLFLNTNGTVKSHQLITGVNRFGSSVGSLGDIDGDGVTDLAVGAADTRTGTVELLFLTANGTERSRGQIASNVGGYGTSVASLGDLDGDGLTDLAIGSGGTIGGITILFSTPLNVNPIFTSLSSASVVENTTFVMTVTATHEDIAPRPIALSLAGGADQTKFTITSGGALSLVTPPDFDMPADANGDNTYEVFVRASNDIGGMATQTIFVTIKFAPSDFGDAPDGSSGASSGNYQTRLMDGGPRHVVVDGVRMGATVSADDGGKQNADADADHDDGLRSYPIMFRLFFSRGIDLYAALA
jgi:hypothetical protein